jgi:hypothetical protein
MGPLTAIVLLAAAVSSGPPAAPQHVPTRAVASASASVRILPGAKVSLSGQAEAQGYKLTDAIITSEDGKRRPAQLVEFQ